MANKKPADKQAEAGPTEFELKVQKFAAEIEVRRMTPADERHSFPGRVRIAKDKYIENVTQSIVALDARFKISFESPLKFSLPLPSVVVSGVTLGPFLAEISVPQNTYVSPYSCLRLCAGANEARKVKVDESTFIHPHVRDGAVCFGGGSDAAHSHVRQGLLFEFVEVLESVLATYNPHSPHVFLNSFKAVTHRTVDCYNCGQPCTEKSARKFPCGHPTCRGCGRKVCAVCRAAACPCKLFRVVGLRGKVCSPKCHRLAMRQLEAAQTLAREKRKQARRDAAKRKSERKARAAADKPAPASNSALPAIFGAASNPARYNDHVGWWSGSIEDDDF